MSHNHTNSPVLDRIYSAKTASVIVYTAIDPHHAFSNVPCLHLECRVLITLFVEPLWILEALGNVRLHLRTVSICRRWRLSTVWHTVQATSDPERISIAFRPGVETVRLASSMHWTRIYNRVAPRTFNNRPIRALLSAYCFDMSGNAVDTVWIRRDAPSRYALGGERIEYRGSSACGYNVT